MKLVSTLLFLLLMILVGPAIAQRNLSLRELANIKDSKWQDIEAMATKRTFHLVLSNNTTERRMAEFLQITPPASEDDALIKRTFYYNDLWIEKRQLNRMILYTTTDGEEYQAMLAWADSSSFKKIPGKSASGGGAWSDGKFKFTLIEKRVPTARGGFMRKYEFEMFLEMLTSKP